MIIRYEQWKQTANLIVFDDFIIKKHETMDDRSIDKRNLTEMKYSFD